MNARFPNARLGLEDVRATWAGLRPLIADRNGRRESSRSRDHAIVQGSGGMITVVGGKLTTYRAMAREVVDRAVRELRLREGRARLSDSRTDEEALPGRPERWVRIADRHRVLDAPVVTDEVPKGMEVAIFGLGCFWGAEEIYWQVPGVWSTSVGYAGGHTPNPSYEEVCSGRTGHTEAVRIVFDPAKVSYADLVRTFFEIHDPTQGMRQGNDIGTQYRSAIYTTTPEQAKVAEELTEQYAEELRKHGVGPITTEIAPAGEYYYAEDAHQQYLAKHVNGYRCHAATGIPFPSGS